MTRFSNGFPLIKVVNLNKCFKNNFILKNVSFEINHGEIVSLFGLSGCGKSTLLSIISGILKQDSGNVFIDLDSNNHSFLNSLKQSKNISDYFGFSSQDPSFFDELTIYENLKYYGTLQNVPKVELEIRIDEILKKFNLFDFKHHKSGDLSEGMKKRVDFSCSIIHNPKILILDEPTSNLDYKLRNELLNYVKKINKLGITIIFVSHYIEEILEISDKVAVLSNCDVKIYENNTTLKHTLKNKI